MDVKVGDKVTRKWIGLRGKVDSYDATVTAVTDTVITCLVIVDVPRTMRFSRKTGYNVSGNEYGWIEK